MKRSTQSLPSWGEAGESSVTDRLTAWAPERWPVAADWRPVVQAYLAAPQGRRVADHIQRRLQAGAVIYPPQPFKALEWTALADVRVVILGQDPYHGPGQAEGLAFSVPAGVRVPPSLRNIFKELAREFGGPMPESGHLGHWARQGVLLLNTTLTVEEGQAASHARCGWEAFSDALMDACGSHAQPKVFMLWGAHAQSKAERIDRDRHLVLCANHPSPLSALRPPVPFIGCGHFAAANAWLQEKSKKNIAWFEDR